MCLYVCACVRECVCVLSATVRTIISKYIVFTQNILLCNVLVVGSDDQ